jgi:DNA polymerase-3 subunit epsilon
MKDFIAIDFETANYQRVSACSLGFAKVINGQITDSKEYLIKPIGGHAPFQSRIHGIKDKHTNDKPNFGELFPSIRDIFQYPLVAHSLFDEQVLNALSYHFGLKLKFNYTDTVTVARRQLPELDNYKLKTLVNYFNLPTFKHHNAQEDAIACANIFLKLQAHSKLCRIESQHVDRKELMSQMALQEKKYEEVERLHQFEKDSSQWGEWNARVHKSEDQINRQHHAFDIFHTIQSDKTILGDASNGIISGYTVTLSYCSCRDFKNRQLPCKHIYSYALINKIQLHLEESEYLKRCKDYGLIC